MKRLSFAALCLASAPALAATGGRALTLTHSGFLLDSADAPVNAPALSVTFRIFDQSAQVASEQIQWQATCAVRVVAGYFTALLGTGACAGADVLDTADLPADAARWIEVSIGDIPLSPRLTVNAVPVASTAQVALDSERFGGLLPGAYWQRTDDLASAKVGSETLGTHTHAPSAITGFNAAAVSAVTAGGLPWGSVSGLTNVTAWPGTIDAARVTNASGTFAATSHTHAGSDLTSAVANATRAATADVASGLAAGTYANAVTFNNASNAFSGSGAGLTNLPAGQLSGTVPAAAVSGSYGNAVTMGNASNAFTGTFTGTFASNAASNALACPGAPEGTFRYNFTTKVMEYCNGTAWTAFATASRTIVSDGSGGRQWSDGTRATSCNGYYSPANGYSYTGLTGDGVYTVNIGGTATQVFCNMSEQGGGWTLLTAFGPLCTGYFSSSNWANTGTNPSANPKTSCTGVYSIWNKFSNVAANATTPTFMLQSYTHDNNWYTHVNTQAAPGGFTNACPTSNTVTYSNMPTSGVTFCGYYLSTNSGGAQITGVSVIGNWYFNAATYTPWTNGGFTGIPVDSSATNKGVSQKNLWYVR